jgi:hypothetical protein
LRYFVGVMLTSVQLKNFRGFKDTSVGPLGRVNLIVGQNNTGKTGLLEALTLLLSEPSDRAGQLPSLFRTAYGNLTENFWKWICTNKDTSKVVEVRGTFDSIGEYGICLGRPSNPGGPYAALGQLGTLPFFRIGKASVPGHRAATFSVHPTNPKQDAVDYNRVVLRRKKGLVEELLKRVEPRLQAVESLQTGNEPLLYADIGLNEMIPVTQMGQGFNRLLDIYSEMVVAEAKVLLIDEIENGLHHSVLPTIWKGLFHAAAEVDVQVFATTHSWECVLAADEAARKADNYELNLIRLDRVADNITATIIGRDAIGTAKELNWEMR